MFVFILSNAGHPLWFPGDAPQKRASGQLTGLQNLAILVKNTERVYCRSGPGGSTKLIQSLERCKRSNFLTCHAQALEGGSFFIKIRREVMYLLVCNVGSTSLKFKLYNMPHAAPLAEGKIERVGSLTDAIYHYRNPTNDWSIKLEGQSIPSYTEGIQKYLADLTHPEHGALDKLEKLERVGFKTVLAKDFYGVHQLTPEVLKGMEEYLPIAPVHNSCYLEAIRRFQEILPTTPLIGVFETAFHTTIPMHRRLFALPYEWYETYGLQRFGYHGASHGYVAQAVMAESPVNKTVSCHLGGSCSLCAIKDGVSQDNSFGFSLQTGILHANRTGDMDAYIIPFLLGRGMPLEEIMAGLEKTGGLLGVSGVDNDLRQVEEAAEKGNARAQLAIDMFVDQIVRYIGSYQAFLGGLDHLVFTGGIGENGVNIRRMVCDRLAHLGVIVDEAANGSGEPRRRISKADSPVKVDIIPADEEQVVARKTYDYAL